MYCYLPDTMLERCLHYRLLIRAVAAWPLSLKVLGHPAGQPMKKYCYDYPLADGVRAFAAFTVDIRD